MAVESKPAAAKATAPKRAPAAKKVAPPVKKTAPPAKKATPAKRAAPAKKATPAPAETNGGTMSRAEAQRVIDQYRPRRGRPPSEVTEARRILGLA
jgi:DNA-binding protein HU-beta